MVLAYADVPSAPDASFFACQHLAKDVLFQSQYLEHPNGTTGVSAVVAVAEKPEDFRTALAGLFGDGHIRATDLGLEADLEDQLLLLLTPAAFRARYHLDPPDPRRGMLFAAFELQALEIERAASHLGRGAKRHEDRIVVPAAPGLGSVMVFRSASNG